MKGEVRTLRFVRLMRAPRERVFAALVEPERMRAWMCPEDFRVTSVEVEPGVGGGFRLVMVDPDGAAYPVRGSYLQLRPPELVEFSWTWEPVHPMASVTTRVRVELAEAEGGTRFVMTHSGFPDDAEADSHEGGWTGALAKLQTFVEEESSQ
jgi:uncharacterized protein YndB with AHSA1/START domain